MEKFEQKHNINYQSDLFMNKLNQLSTSIEQEESIIQNAMCGNLDKYITRPFAWKLFLQILRPNDNHLFDVISLFDQQTKLNSDYQTKLAAINSKRKFQGDPLAREQDTEWKAFYHQAEIKKILRLDIMRTYQGTNLFQTKAIHKILENVLLIWSAENPDISYKQGMNEIAAVIICALYPYYVNKSQVATQSELKALLDNKNNKEIYSIFHNEFYMESDIYHIFRAIMEHGLINFYDSGSPDVKGVSYKIYELFTLQWNNDDISVDPKLKQKSENIFKVKLKQINEELYNHFTLIGLNCTVFLQRWLKCLFNREFDITSVVYLWDAILAYRNDMEFVEYISLSIVNGLHYNLMEKNQDDSFQYIFDFIKFNKRSILTVLIDAVEIKDFFTKTESKKSMPTKSFVKKYSKEIYLSNSLPKTETNLPVNDAKDFKKSQNTYISSALNSLGSIFKGVVSLDLGSPVVNMVRTSSVDNKNANPNTKPNAKPNTIANANTNTNTNGNGNDSSTNTQMNISIDIITLDAKESNSKIEEMEEVIEKYKQHMTQEDIDIIEGAMMFFKKQINSTSSLS